MDIPRNFPLTMRVPTSDLGYYVGPGDSSDLDKEWADFRRRVRERKESSSRSDSQTSTSSAPPPPPPPTAPSPNDPSYRSIRKVENALLDAWVGDGARVSGAVGIVILIAIVAAGAPPHDPRCTLPFC